MTLTQDQIRKIVSYVNELAKTKSDFQNEIKAREKKEELIREMLSVNELEDLDEFRLGELISNLWATQGWTNKDYLINKIISANGLEK